ncbi:MAG: sensor histidine kinase [Proteobacteria bacterium]|nr:sensor histidine kinase [Pseudomonadota bacterium]
MRGLSSSGKQLSSGYHPHEQMYNLGPAVIQSAKRFQLLLEHFYVAFVFISLLMVSATAAAEEAVFDIASLQENLPVNQYVYTAGFTDEHLAAFESSPIEFIEQQLIPDAAKNSTTSASNFGWLLSTENRISIESDSGLSWFYINLENSADASKGTLLEFVNVDGVGWVKQLPTGEIQLVLPEYDAYIGGRIIYDTQFVVPVELDANSQTQLVGFTYNVSSPRIVSIFAWEPEAFRTQRTKQHFSDGIYYGFLLALVIYNLTLGMVLKQYSYLYAGAFQLFVGAIVFVSTGYSTLFVLQNNQTLTIPIFGLLFLLAGISSSLFSLSILQIKQHSLTLYRLWAGLIIWGLIQVPLVLMTAIPAGVETNSNRLLLSMNALTFLFSQGVHVYTLVFVWHRISIAKYWFVAITLQVWLIMAWQLTANFGVGFSTQIKYFVQLFTLINGGVLTWLIGHTLSEELEAKELAQQEALSNLRMANDIQQSKANFISTAGHDLRQPLQAIRLHITALKETASASTGEVLRKVEGNIFELSALLNSLMNLSRSTSYIEQDANDEVFLEDVLNNLKDEIGPFAAQKGIALEFQEAPYLVKTSKVGLTQILRNLLNNAVKFTRSGSVKVLIEPAGDVICVSVADTGPGIPSEELEDIFTEFYQVKGDAAANKAGMGIGLSIVRRLSDALKIPLNVESRVGHGTEFHLEIPVSSANKITRMVVSDPTSLNGLKVSIVHRSAERRNELKTTLEQWGAMALTWPTLCDMFDYVKKHNWQANLVILDQVFLEELTETGASKQHTLDDEQFQLLSTRTQTIVLDPEIRASTKRFCQRLHDSGNRIPNTFTGSKIRYHLAF